MNWVRSCLLFKVSSLPKIYHTYSTITKFGSYTLPKEDPKKYINNEKYPLISADISIFFTGNQQNLLYQEIQL